MECPRPSAIRHNTVSRSERLPPLFSILFIKEASLKSLTSQPSRLLACSEARKTTKTTCETTSDMVVRVVSRLIAHRLKIIMRKFYLLTPSDTAICVRSCGIAVIRSHQPIRPRKSPSAFTPHTASLTLVESTLVSRLTHAWLTGTATSGRKSSCPAILTTSEITKNILIIARKGTPSI